MALKNQEVGLNFATGEKYLVLSSKCSFFTLEAHNFLNIEDILDFQKRK